MVLQPRDESPYYANQAMTDPTLPPPGRAREMALKTQRKAEQLRANLRRRKDQTRAREVGDDDLSGADIGIERKPFNEAG